MDKPVSSEPFKRLGGELRAIRQQRRESVVETSGAVEIDTDMLERIERGAELPSEDILMLLISHFNVHDDAAVELWQLAGYDSDEPSTKTSLADDSQLRSVVLMMALDTRILYSNNTQLTADHNGVVLNFLQGGVASGEKNQQVPVARIGMSYQQAHEFLHALAHTLARADNARRPKGLPYPKNKKPNQS